MKKFIALAIAVIMIAALAVPAFAATSGETDVTYTVGESYVLTVPATLTVGGAAGKLVVSDYNVLAENNVVVTASGEFKLTSEDAEGEYAYALNATTFTFADDGEQDVTATWGENEAPTAAGTYEDTITFTGAIVAAAQ